MKNFTVKILCLVCIISACFALVACGRKTKLDNLVKEGYYVSVKYDPNGGKFCNGDNSSLVDFYKPSDYTADKDGKVTVKLIDPDADVRWTNYLINNAKVARDGYFCVGWYKNRALVLDEDNDPISEKGEKLYYDKNSQKYFLLADKDNEKKSEVVPKYTYSDPWDFSKDTFSFNATDASYQNIKNGKDVKPLMTLYAAWLPKFSFEYYAKNEKNEWASVGVTTFDYMDVKKNREKFADKSLFDDTVVFPCFETKNNVPVGKMIYRFTETNSSEGYSYSFSIPESSGKSFVAAYLTEADANSKTNNVGGDIYSETGLGALLRHDGTVDFSNATAENSVKKVYLEYKDGCDYYIGNDEANWAVSFREYLKNDPKGTFYIKTDLDLSTDKSENNWVSSISTGTFNGVMKSYDGTRHAIKNASVELSATNAGGLFGTLGKNAVIKDLSFENVTVDISFKTANITDGKFGLFAGKIMDGATIENVSVGGTIRILGTTPVLTQDRLNDSGGVLKSKNSVINLVANAENAEITQDLLNKFDNKGVTVVIYALKSGSGKYAKYYLAIDRKTAKIKDGYVYYDSLARNEEIDIEKEGVEFTLTAD